MIYKRILLKLSGEVLSKNGERGIQHEQLLYYTEEIKKIHALGVKVAIVVGGGNIHRGGRNVLDLDRVESDKMGMLATVINGIALHSYLNNHSVPSLHLSSFDFSKMLPTYSRCHAMETLEKGTVVILTGGLGLPYFTTDTAASLRGIELKMDVILKATQVDGIYAADPKLDPTAHKFDHLTFQAAMEKNLAILDKTAFVLCEAHSLPLIVFNITTPDALRRVVLGEQIGTVVGKNYC
ncbi:MAG: UMP kinase [Amoebophilaceae bacterium]|nr:UMP kinase [Amoebophilaceae bacterium]